MNSDQMTSHPLPKGSEFLALVSKVEAACSVETLAEIPELGISTPACFEALGNVLSALYAEAACSYGCTGGDHFCQRLTSRVVSNSLASVRLALSGYYDESLALTRNVGEIANLLFLFAARPEMLEFWRASDDKHRKKHFGPVKVRLALEELSLRPPIDESRYGLLCEVGVQLVPSVTPQSFDKHGRASLGAKFKDVERMVTLNELAIVVAEAAACVSTLSFVGIRALSLRAGAGILLNMVGELDLKAGIKGPGSDCF